MKIANIRAREILDSRGIPTLEATVELEGGITVSASVPSGTSTGSHEAHELRDGGARYGGKGVLKAVKNVNEKISPALQGLNVNEQSAIDERMINLDGTPFKKKLGANAILGVSVACARAAALAHGEPLYRYLERLITKNGNGKNSGRVRAIPMCVLFEGGVHADTNLDLQEFMVVPHACATFAERLERVSAIRDALKLLLHVHGYETDVGMEGGFAPQMRSSIEALELLVAAGKKAGFAPGVDFSLALDVGGSILFDDKKKGYLFKLDHQVYSSTDLLALWRQWLKLYPIMSIEDPFAEDDWDTWTTFLASVQRKNGHTPLIVGDDLLVTNVARLEEGLKRRAVNAVIVKPNQVGTLTETFAFVAAARKAKMTLVVSHRSGETCDDWISDLAVAVNAEYVKFGAPCRGERVTKYNRLLAIEKEFGK